MIKTEIFFRLFWTNTHVICQDLGSVEFYVHTDNSNLKYLDLKLIFYLVNRNL